MKELDVTKKYHLGDLSDEQLEELVVSLSNMGNAGIFRLGNLSTIKGHIKSNYQLATNKDYKTWGLYAKDYWNRKVINALTLFEPQLKQGDKVLYTDDLVNWEEGVYLVKHNESYIIESDEMLIYAINVKPYEDEIKVGDRVVSELNDCVFKYQFGRLKDDLTKITDEVLIYKLNELNEQ